MVLICLYVLVLVQQFLQTVLYKSSCNALKVHILHKSMCDKVTSRPRFLATVPDFGVLSQHVQNNQKTYKKSLTNISCGVPEHEHHVVIIYSSRGCCKLN